MPGQAPDDAVARDSEQWREVPNLDALDLSLSDSLAALDWQPELDSALEAIDSVLPIKRRRASDPPGATFPRPELSGLTFTPEVLDALATRVAEKLRAQQPPPQPVERPQPRMKRRAIVTIRYRWPLFSFGAIRYERRIRARASA